MGTSIVNRIQTLDGCDKLLLLFTVGWAVVEVPGNYFQLRGRGQFWVILTIALWVGIVGVVAYTITRRRHLPADYGFSFKSGSFASLAIIAVIHACLLVRGTFVLSQAHGFVLSAVGAFMEEIAFRVIAIDKIILLLNGVRAKAFWAIVASSVLWSVPHIVSKALPQLVGGILLGGLCLGYIYYKAMSILLPAWIHAVANAGYRGGLLIVGVYCLIAAVDYGVRASRRHLQPISPLSAPLLKQ